MASGDCRRAAERALRARSSRRRRPTCDRPRVAVVGERVQVAARRRGRASRRARPRGAARPAPTVAIPRACELRGRHRPDAPEPLDRQRVEEVELAVRRHDEQAVGLRHAARDLGEELRPRDADRDRQADLLAAPRAAAARRSRSACRRSARARERRGTPRRSTAPRRAASCRRTPGTPPCSPRSRPTCAAGRRPPADTAGGPARRPSQCGRRSALAS